jgi:hypothetical protein
MPDADLMERTGCPNRKRILANRERPMSSKRMVPEQEIAELSDEMVRRDVIHEAEIATLTEQRDRAMTVLREPSAAMILAGGAQLLSSGEYEPTGADGAHDIWHAMAEVALAALDTPTSHSLPERIGFGENAIPGSKTDAG